MGLGVMRNDVDADEYFADADTANAAFGNANVYLCCFLYLDDDSVSADVNVAFASYDVYEGEKNDANAASADICLCLLMLPLPLIADK